MKNYAEWVITQVKFRDGSTSYNLNRVVFGPEKQDREWITQAKARLGLDIRLGRKLSPVQLLLLQEPEPSCTVLAQVDCIIEAKQLVNHHCANDGRTIRKQRFKI
jgi:hypothetical protein